MIFIKKIITAILNCVGFIFSKTVPKKNIIVFEGTDVHRYNENARYLFEYMSCIDGVYVYWFTRNSIIRDFLNASGYKTTSGIFETMYILASAKLVVSNGSRPIDYFNSVGSNTIKYCLMHGTGPKASIYLRNSLKSTIRELKSINKFDYVNFTSSFTSMLTAKVAYKIPYEKIIKLGYPRNDCLFDKDLCDDLCRKKPKMREVISNIDKDSKLLLYTPTWRNDPLMDLPIVALDGFEFSLFNDFLAHNNLHLIYTLHPNSSMKCDLNYSNIHYLDYSKYPLFDLNNVMPEFDLLLNDYSTTSVDFCILNRPQLFVMPDYDDYIDKDAFLEDYRSILPGEEISSFSLLKEKILNSSNKADSYSNNRRIFLNKYYDFDNINNSCKNHSDFIIGLIK